MAAKKNNNKSKNNPKLDYFESFAGENTSIRSAKKIPHPSVPQLCWPKPLCTEGKAAELRARLAVALGSCHRRSIRAVVAIPPSLCSVSKAPNSPGIDKNY